MTVSALAIDYLQLPFIVVHKMSAKSQIKHIIIYKKKTNVSVILK